MKYLFVKPEYAERIKVAFNDCMDGAEFSEEDEKFIKECLRIALESVELDLVKEDWDAQSRKA